MYLLYYYCKCHSSEVSSSGDFKKDNDSVSILNNLTDVEQLNRHPTHLRKSVFYFALTKVYKTLLCLYRIKICF